MIPGGWKIGDQCYFSHPEKHGLLNCRAIGTIEDYDPNTHVLSIRYEDRIFRQTHTSEFGGISGVRPPTVYATSGGSELKYISTHRVSMRRLPTRDCDADKSET